MRRGDRQVSIAQASVVRDVVKRCAVYTRKSTEEGLDQDFNALQAQREACEAYVASQRHEGWILVPTAYDDGGYSGGSMERPGMQALLSDIDAGRIDVVVVYKVDRLTRSLADFARMVERFDRRAVSFVSVTQAFNTTSSMGRLTLNVLLSFAQFEREVGAERVRDKIAASRKKGIWMGGTVPLGYRAEDRKLVIVAEEAERVREIFQRYLILGSTTRLLAELNRRGIRTAKRESRRGNLSGDVPFGTGSISYLLRNHTYIGEVVHKGMIYPGEHEPILDRSLFEDVQQKLSSQAPARRGRRPASPSLLTGLIFDSRGNRMSPAHANKRGVRYRYYVSRAIAEGRKAEAGDPARVSAPDVEAVVLQAIRVRLGDGRIEDHASSAFGARPEARMHEGMTDEGGTEGWSDRALVSNHLRRLTVCPGRLSLELLRHQHDRYDQLEAPCDTAPVAGMAEADISETVTVPWSSPSRRPHQSIVEGQGDATDDSPSVDERRRLAHAIQTGRSWLAELASGSSASLDAIARRENKHLRTIRSTIALAFLAPDIVERLIDQGLPAHWTISDIARRLPRSWPEQRKMFAA